MSTSIKRLPLILWVVLLGVHGLARPLSFEEAVQFAVDHSPIVDEARHALTIAKLQRQNTFNAFLPSLDFTTTDGFQQLQPPGPTDPYTSYLNLSLTENLYDNGQTLTQYKIAKLAEQASQVNLKKNRDQICLSVAQQFYLYSLDVKLQAVREEQLKILRRQLESVSNEYRQGFKTRKDYLRMKSQVQTAELSLYDAQNAAATAVSELRRIVGTRVEKAEADQLDFQPVEPAEVEPQVPQGPLPVENTFDYRLLALNKKINDLNVNLVVRNYWPQVKLSVSGNYAHANFIGPTTGATGSPVSNTSIVPINTPSGFITGTEQFGWTGLVTITYNLWDWGTRKNNIEIAESNRDISNDQYTETFLTTSKDIRNLLLDLTRLQKEFKLQKGLLVADQEIYDLLESDYREGKIAYLDLITSLSDLLSAKISFYTAYFNLLTDVAQYHYNEGTLYEAIIGH